MVSKSKFRIPRSIGFGAGLLALILVVYSAVGAVWGMWRPTLTGREVEDGGYAIENVADVQFSSFIASLSWWVSWGFVSGCFLICAARRSAV